MTLHVMHLTVTPLGEPALQVRFVFRKFDVAHTDGREAQLGREPVEIAAQTLPIQ